MQTEEIIPANEFCIHNNIALSFIYSLNESGLIQVVNIEENIFLPVNQLNHLEKIARLYHELDINIEGIETIMHLLQRIEGMQQQVNQLTNKLRFYENESSPLG